MDKKVWLSRRALKLHAVILVVVPGFMALCVWQIYRATGGNELSWAYVFEWPFFAAYAIYMWWRFVHETPETPVATAAPPAASEAGRGDGPGDRGGVKDVRGAGEANQEGGGEDAGDGQDPELAAYNAYLAQLAARDKAGGR